MKTFKNLASIVLASAIMLSTSAFAGNTVKKQGDTKMTKKETVKKEKKADGTKTAEKKKVTKKAKKGAKKSAKKPAAKDGKMAPKTK